MSTISNIQLDTVERAMLLVHGHDDMILEDSVPPLDELAKRACEHTYAIAIVKIVSGTVEVDGQPDHSISSDEPLSARRFFIDGEVFDVSDNIQPALDAFLRLPEEVASTKRMMQEGVHLINLKMHGATQVVLCRTGVFEAYEPDQDDTILVLDTEVPTQVATPTPADVLDSEVPVSVMEH